MITFQYLSDLHDKYPEITPLCDYIVLLGDIGDPYSSKYKSFLNDLSSKFKKVFLVPGNHEYYFKVVDECNSYLHTLCYDMENVYFLNNKAVEVDGYLLIGSTLWSDINYQTACRLNDFRYIRMYKDEFMDISYYLELHQESVNYIQNQLEINTQNKPVIVFSHHAPLHEMNGKFQNSFLSSAYSSDLSNLTKNVKAWLSGHTHQCLTLNKNNITYSSNCMGYTWKGCSNFKLNKTITIT
jgi:predicted phosphohydrolase